MSRGGYSPATISAIRLQKLREILVEEPTVAKHELHAAGWRRCAEGQGETQHCALLEAAVLAEREACAEVLVGKIKRHEQIAQECALRGEYDEVTGLRRTARKLSECVAEIRARGQE